MHGRKVKGIKGQGTITVRGPKAGSL